MNFSPIDIALLLFYAVIAVAAFITVITARGK